jgi:hypothetical protein
MPGELVDQESEGVACGVDAGNDHVEGHDVRDGRVRAIA